MVRAIYRANATTNSAGVFHSFHQCFEDAPPAACASEELHDAPTRQAAAGEGGRGCGEKDMLEHLAWTPPGR